VKLNLQRDIQNPTFGHFYRRIKKQIDKPKLTIECNREDNQGNPIIIEKKPIIVFIHTLMGNARHDYNSIISCFNSEWNIFFINARTDNKASFMDDNIMELAQDYLEQLSRNLTPNRLQEPLMFVGWSGGGLIATAMTYLRQQQHKLTACFVIDSVCPDSLRQMTNVDFYTKYLAHLITSSYIGLP